VIHEGNILDILPQQQAQQKYQALQTETLDTHALIPGFINAHTHVAMSLFRGIADDLPLMNWLEKHIWPLEKNGQTQSLCVMVRCCGNISSILPS
jgi:5-methylthioadenosine/S-adenosylhomocysteine deaminase